MAFKDLALTTTLFVLFTTVLAGPSRFQTFFPEYNAYFTRIRDGECAALYAEQQSETSYAYCPQLLSCLLDHASEAIKANMASATVLLGLMPTILTSLSSSPSETALLSRRRPFLALALALGSPAVNQVSTFVHPDPIQDVLEHSLNYRENNISDRAQSLKPLTSPLANFESTLLRTWMQDGSSHRLSRVQSITIVFIEYLLVFASIANVALAAVSTGQWTVNTVSCSTSYLPILWVFLTVVAHVASVIALMLRTKTKDPVPSPTEVIESVACTPHGDGSRNSTFSAIRKGIEHEFTPCVAGEELCLDLKNDSVLFVAVSWFNSIYLGAYLLFGTIAFSTLMFISTCLQGPMRSPWDLA